MAENDGASPYELLMAAARSGNNELLYQVLYKDKVETDVNVNHQDGLGNTALHYVVSSNADGDTILTILDHRECDPNIPNRTERATPLHLAVRIQDPVRRESIVGLLLDYEADPNIRDKNGDKPLDLVPADDTETRGHFRAHAAQTSISNADIADDDDDDEGSAGSGSESE